MANEQIQALKAAAIAVGRDGRTDDEWFHYLQCVHYKFILSLLADRDADKALIADQAKRISELQGGQKKLIGWRASDYTDETSDPELAKNWAAAIGVLPIFEGDVNTKLEARTVTVKLPPKVDSSNVPFAAHAWNSCIDEVSKCLTAAGITLVVGE